MVRTPPSLVFEVLYLRLFVCLILTLYRDAQARVESRSTESGLRVRDVLARTVRHLLTVSSRFLWYYR